MLFKVRKSRTSCVSEGMERTEGNSTEKSNRKMEWKAVKQMRLIDADKLILHLNDYALQEAPFGRNDSENQKEIYETIQECMKAVEEQPTAFDAEKVLNKLKHEESEALRRYSESKGTAYAFSDKCSCDNWAKAIGIVKRGGTDEE